MILLDFVVRQAPCSTMEFWVVLHNLIPHTILSNLKSKVIAMQYGAERCQIVHTLFQILLELHNRYDGHVSKFAGNPDLISTFKIPTPKFCSQHRPREVQFVPSDCYVEGMQRHSVMMTKLKLC